jgi:hypothetical protein
VEFLDVSHARAITITHPAVACYDLTAAGNWNKSARTDTFGAA